jgi:aminoglycoside phosphotransferase (APT) family kinase protein
VQADDRAPPVGVRRHGDDRGDGHDPPAFVDLEAGSVEPEMRPVAFERALEERADALVDVLAQLRDLGTASRPGSC